MKKCVHSLEETQEIVCVGECFESRCKSVLMESNFSKILFLLPSELSVAIELHSCPNVTVNSDIGNFRVEISDGNKNEIIWSSIVWRIFSATPVAIYPFFFPLYSDQLQRHFFWNYIAVKCHNFSPSTDTFSHFWALLSNAYQSRWNHTYSRPLKLLFLTSSHWPSKPGLCIMIIYEQIINTTLIQKAILLLSNENRTPSPSF